MKQQIKSFIDELKLNKKISTFEEASTKQAIVLKLLSLLEWDIFNVDEVCPNFAFGSYTVSYALIVSRKNRIFIEVKSPDEKLDNHQKQLLASAVREAVNLCVLTNGVEWRFYLVSAKGECQPEWFHAIDLLNQKADSITAQFIDLLSKDHVSKGRALKTVKELYQNHKQNIGATAVSQAWNQIISEPNTILVELLSEWTDQLYGHKVESDQIKKFLKSHLNKWLVEDMHIVSLAASDNKIEKLLPQDEPITMPAVAGQLASIKNSRTCEAKQIKAFTFDGRTYEVGHWEELLTTLCNHFANIHPKEFEKVLWISGPYTVCFSRNEEDLEIPEKIKKTDIFVETKLGPDEIVKTARLLLAEFGYSKDLLSITTL